MSVIRPEKVKVCLKCPFWEEPFVPSNGPSDARLMLVGEAPGHDEVVEGRGFVGRSGIELDQDLEEAGIDREELYIANVIKCQIPRGVVKQGREVRQATECCRKRLAVEIRRLRPRLILGFGDVALRSLTGSQGVTRHRGNLLNLYSEIQDQVKDPSIRAFITFHPAFILRGNDAYRPVVVEDLKTAMRILRGQELGVAHPVEYVYCTTYAKALELLRELRRQPTIFYDSETTAWSKKFKKVVGSALDFWTAKIYLMQFSWKKYSAWVLPWYGQGLQRLWTPTQKEYLKKSLIEIFESPGHIWVIQHAPFDLRHLHHFGVDVWKMEYADLLSGQNLANENAPRDLDSLALIYTDMGNYKNAMAKRVMEVKGS